MKLMYEQLRASESECMGANTPLKHGQGMEDLPLWRLLSERHVCYNRGAQPTLNPRIRCQPWTALPTHMAVATNATCTDRRPLSPNQGQGQLAVVVEFACS